MTAMMGREPFRFKAAGAIYDNLRIEGAADVRCKDPLRRRFPGLVNTTSRGVAGRRANRFEPTSRLGEPSRGNRELGHLPKKRTQKPASPGYRTSAQTRIFPCQRASTRLDRVDQLCQGRNRGGY